MKDQLAELADRNQDQTVQLDRLNQELRLLTSPDAVHVSLNPQKAPQAAQRYRHLQPVAEAHDVHGQQPAAGA